MVEMTEPPTPAPAGFNNKTNGFAEQAQFDRDRKAGTEPKPSLNSHTANCSCLEGGAAATYDRVTTGKTQIEHNIFATLLLGCARAVAENCGYFLR
jgi:hypothetical protein